MHRWCGLTLLRGPGDLVDQGLHFVLVSALQSLFEPGLEHKDHNHKETRHP